jgi:general secretion pathway protein D
MGRLNFKFKYRAALFLFAAVILVGCAGQRLHNEGLALLESGRNEEGLEKLAAASKADPDNLTYRSALVRNRELIIGRMLTNASSERAQEHYAAAQTIYESILRIDQNNNAARDGIAALEMDHRHIGIISEATAYLKKGDFDSAQAVLKPVLIENQKNNQAMLLQRQIDEQVSKVLLAEPALQGKFKKPVTLQFRDANLKMVFEALSRTSGINVLLDKDVKADIKTSIFVKDVSIEDAIDLILLQSQLEKKIISDNTVFVYPNTPAKLKDYQDLKIRSFHLTNSDPKQVMNMVKTLLKTKDILVNEKTNSIVMRDTPEAIRLAEKMINDQDTADPEVMLEVEVLEVNRTRLSQIGINFPSKLTLTTPSGTANAGLTLSQLQNVSAGDLITSPALATTLNLMMQDGTTNLLASPRIRVRNREKAKIMIGDRVPIITNAVTPVSTGTPVVTGNVQYMDVGMKLEVEPEIHLDNDISIKVHLDVSSIVKEINNAVSGTQAYQIGTRNASTVLRLRDGETQILAGLISDEDRKTSNKVPGLGQLPVLGRLFSSDGDNISKTEIILSITPRIVGRKAFPDAREVEYWSGTEASLRTSSLTMKSLGSIGFSNPAKTPEAPAAINHVPAAGTASAAAAAATVEKAARDLATQPVVISWAGPNQAKVGDKISVMINTPIQLGVKSLSFQVGYDASVLKAVDVIEGNLMKQNNAQTNLVKTINQKNGIVLVGLSGTASGESSGGGNIVTLEFEVIGASPSSPISVSRITSAAISGGSLALSAPDPHVISVMQ